MSFTFPKVLSCLFLSIFHEWNSVVFISITLKCCCDVLFYAFERLQYDYLESIKFPMLKWKSIMVHLMRHIVALLAQSGRDKILCKSDVLQRIGLILFYNLMATPYFFSYFVAFLLLLWDTYVWEVSSRLGLRFFLDKCEIRLGTCLKLWNQGSWVDSSPH